MGPSSTESDDVESSSYSIWKNAGIPLLMQGHAENGRDVEKRLGLGGVGLFRSSSACIKFFARTEHQI